MLPATWNALTPAERTTKLTKVMPEAAWKSLIAKLAVKSFDDLSSVQKIAVGDELS